MTRILRFTALACVMLICRSDGASTSCSQLDKDIENLRQGIAHDQDNLKKSITTSTADEISQWGSLTEQTKDDLYKSMVDALLTNALSGNALLLKRFRSINPWESQRLIGSLKEVGITDPFLWDAIRAIGKVKDKQLVTRDLDIINEALQRSKDVTSVATASPATVGLESMSTVLTTLSQMPVMDRIAANSKLLAAIAYANTELVLGNHRSDQLTQVAETQLRVLDVFKKRTQAAVQKLNAAKAIRAKMPDCKDTQPPKQAQLTGTIVVISATYGPACGVATGNDTRNLASKCDGKSRCSYLVSNARVGGDPVFGCAKDYVATYRCSSNLQKISHGPVVSENYSVVLECTR